MDTVGGSIVWNIDANNANFNRQIEESSTKVKGLAKDIDNSSNKISSSLKEAANGSKVFALGIAAATTAAVAFGFKAVQAFNESEQVTARLTKLILNQTGATMKNVDALKQQAVAMQKVTTFGDDLVMMAQSQFATFDLTSESIQKMIPGFLDMVAAEKGANVSMEEMKITAQGFGKALVGQTDALVKQGFIFSELQKEILKTGTEEQRLAVINEVLGKTYGGMAATMRDTFQGQMTVAQNTLSDLMELIGKAISDALLPAIKAFNDWTISIGGADGIMKIINETGAKFKSWLPVIIGIIVGGLIPALVAATIAMWALFAPLLPFIAAGALLGLTIKVIIDHFGGLDATMRKLVVGFQIVKEKWDWLINSFRSGIQVIKDIINIAGGVPGKIGDNIRGAISSVFGGGRAMGGPVSAGRSYLVGERGPELFTPGTSGTITPNGVDGNTINIYVSEKADWNYGIELMKRELGLDGLRANAGIA